MSAQWQSLVSQKLTLAGALLRAAPRCQQPLEREATLQGAIELMLSGRRLLMTLIARYYQHKQAAPETLAALAELIGEETPEVSRLTDLAGQSGSWWHHLDGLAQGQYTPPQQRKNVSADNIIAVSAVAGPDRSTEAMTRTLEGMKAFLETVTEWHDEW